MMRKNVSRLLALVLVLCMVVLCVPVRAYAETPVRPEGMSDEEWEAYLLRMKQLLTATDTEVAKDASVTETIPPQSVTVEVPVDQGAIVEGNTATVIETETVTVEGGTPATDPETGEEQTVDVTVEDTYAVEAKITDVETDGDAVTEIEYEISMNKTTEKTTEGGTTTETTQDVDLKAKEEADASGTPAPEYKVEMTVKGMDDEKITRVTHTKRSASTSSTSGTPAPATTEDTEDEVEYFYNAANGTEDTSKKYFTIEEKVTQKEDAGVVTTVTEKVVSLWTSFLGIFHITTDAFEGAEKADGTKDTYANLSDAAAANSGKTVEMLRDYETASTATISNGVTVDLNDHVYTNTSDTAAIAVSGTGTTVTIENGAVISNGDGIKVGGQNNKFSLRDILGLRSNADGNAAGDNAAISISGSNNVVSVEDSYIDGSDSKYGIQDTSAEKNIVNIEYSSVLGQTGVGLKNTNATISGSDVSGISGAAVEVDGNTKSNSVIITSGRFDSGKYAHDIYTEDNGDIASIIVKGGKFNDPAGLYKYIAKGYALMSHNDGSYYVYEVVPTSYTPSRDGYRFLGFTDGNGKAITLADAYARGIVAYAQWKAIPEKTVKAVTVNDLIKAKTDEKGCTIKVNAKGDTAYIIVKDKNGEIAPISEVKISSVKQLQNLKIDTIEIQVDEDVTLVLDIEKAKKNGFADDIEVTLEKDTLMITSGEDTCMELDIAELKASDKPVEIQLVEGELTVMLGKSSSLSVDLTKALKTGERIVVKLENGVLKLYDKYNKPIEET